VSALRCREKKKTVKYVSKIKEEKKKKKDIIHILLFPITKKSFLPNFF